MLKGCLDEEEHRRWRTSARTDWSTVAGAERGAWTREVIMMVSGESKNEASRREEDLTVQVRSAARACVGKNPAILI